MRFILFVALAGIAFGQASNNVVTDSTSDDAGTASNHCKDQKDQASCVAYGRGNASSTVYTACIWCGVSSQQGESFFHSISRFHRLPPGLCHEPRWAGQYSCPLSTSLFDYDCLPGDTVSACGSHCINSCETESAVFFSSPLLSS